MIIPRQCMLTEYGTFELLLHNVLLIMLSKVLH